jgi:hypothetical protein
MQIYVHRDGQQLGPFGETEIKDQLALGHISEKDLVWWEGQPGWVALDQSSLAGMLTAPLPFVAPAMVVPPVSGPVNSSSGDKTSGLAVCALVSGVVSLFLGITFIVAVILGHMGLAEIRRNPGMKGRGMAIAGLVMGYSVPVILVFISVVAISVFLALGNQVKSTFKTINAQLAQAELADTNSDQSPAPATNSAPDSTTNAAPQPSGN